MALEVEIANSPALDIVVAAGTIGAALAAAWAAWVANRQNKRLTERKLHFGSWLETGKSLRESSLHLSVTNDSFRPITLRQVGFVIPGTHHAISVPQPDEPPLNLTLRDGQSSEWIFPFREFLAGLRQHGKVVAYFAIDTRGVVHSAPYSGNAWHRIKHRFDNWRTNRRFKRQAMKALKALDKTRDRSP